jgi:AraC-like DNA-binding protein
MKQVEYPPFYLYKRIVQAKLYIDSNYDRNIDLNQMAGEACFSKFHFIRAFRKVYGCPPHQYLMRVRIDKAMVLLKELLPVSQVCYSVGFESFGSFSALFKRMVGLPPSVFLEKQRQRKNKMDKMPLQFVPACFAFQHECLSAHTQK